MYSRHRARTSSASQTYSGLPYCSTRDRVSTSPSVSTPSARRAPRGQILDRAVAHVADLSADPEYSATPFINAGFRSALSVPMLRNGEPIGAINVTREEARAFTDRQIELLETFADQGGLRLSNRLARLWDEMFPLIAPPRREDGLGVAILNSNADTNFSFTNALGMIPADHARRLTAALDHYPKARWIVALHHHLIEYPMPVAAFSERIGTALINGSWFQRVLKPYAERVIVMHGHRHVDWIGACGELKVVSAPSPVMAPDTKPTHFYVHALGPAPDGSLALMRPTRIDLAPAEGAGDT